MILYVIITRRNIEYLENMKVSRHKHGINYNILYNIEERAKHRDKERERERACVYVS